MDTNLTENGVETQNQETAVEETKVDDALSQLQKELETTKANLEKSRKGEKFNQAKRIELENQLKELSTGEDYKAKYEAAEAKLLNMALDVSLTEAAKAAKAKSIPAILKLIDRNSVVVNDGVVDTKTVEAAITKAKQEYGILFEEVQLPPTGRAAEGEVTAGYDKEIRAAKSHAELVAVMKKYNK